MSARVLRALPQKPLGSLRRLPCASNLAWRSIASSQSRIGSLRFSSSSHDTQSSNTTVTTPKPYYVTTPIFYVNAAPHVGHLYSMVLADVFKRWHELRHPKAPVKLLTGVDEHGLKIQQAAALAEKPPKKFCDTGAHIFQDLAHQANISYTDFVRTTDEAHIKSVQHCWEVLRDRGYIYETKHEGWYSVSDEAFYPDSQIEKRLDPATGRTFLAAKETGKEVEWSSEINYRFKLSAFKERLLELYANDPDKIVPKSRMTEVVEWISNNLDDLSISRPRDRLSWGIPVPGDETQTIYVWLDALTNYMNRAGYPWTGGEMSAGGWPADLQIIGKDIVRFHCVYWPAFLMALELPLPKQFLVHAHWTMNHQKMSKSVGNVVNPFLAMQRYTPDTMRYFLAYDGGIKDDSDYDNSRITQRYEELRTGLGNMFSRTAKMRDFGLSDSVAAARDGKFAFKGQATEDFISFIKSVPVQVEESFHKLDPSRALKIISSMADQANKYLTFTQPWKAYKAKTSQGPDHVHKALETLYLCFEVTRISAILLQPFMPEKSHEILDQLGVSRNKRTFEFASLGKDTEYGVVDKGKWGEDYALVFPSIPSDD